MPLPIIRTERMTLIPWTRKDVDALHGFWTLPEVRRFLWDDVVINIDVVEDSVASHLATVEQHSIGYWNIHLAAQESSPKKPLAGFCGFRFVDGGPEIELMYGLRPEYWGKGLATEASLAAIEYLWNSTEFQQVYARTDPPNKMSVRVMERLAMAPESAAETTVTYVLRRRDRMIRSLSPISGPLLPERRQPPAPRSPRSLL